MNDKRRWYVVNRDNLKVRGPYLHEETADAVRAEMENRWPNKEWWSLSIVFEVEPEGVDAVA